ncbi:hydrogenase expression/formation protein [Oricola thermophila]|uniref:Hydrogenase expression/formation protein n=1 Tax=Oricola thermophila TaxID=2742145 RepID=A0A6N1VCL6_9HYPH|nr:hydrogenase expression/formation protein [Oricola thermophila]QKV17315.1 hydrogenase expression/formation protein [Oricola thermophila]
MTNPISPLVGPGSQPGEEDGATLNYLQMPSGMMTFAVPDLPESEQAEGLEAGKAVLETVLAITRGEEVEGMVDLTSIDAVNLEFVNQVLGEGEVSVIAGSMAQAQESVLAGVWRVRETGESGDLLRDYLEVGDFPSRILAHAFTGAKNRVPIASSFGPNIFNAPPLLPEINDHIDGAGSETHVINLSLLPHTEEDLAYLNDVLGRGMLTILSRGYGNCRITATDTENVWWVQFYNSQDTMILNTIEITSIPEVACASPEDIADSAERLDEILEIYR